jgi:hypothetical protein
LTVREDVRRLRQMWDCVRAQLGAGDSLRSGNSDIGAAVWIVEEPTEWEGAGVEDSSRGRLLRSRLSRFESAVVLLLVVAMAGVREKAADFETPSPPAA